MIPVRHIDKFGVSGSVFAGMCSLELPPLVAIFPALGLGWLLEETVIDQMLFASFVIMFAGLVAGARYHRNVLALFVAAVGAGLLASSMLVFHGRATTYVGMAVLIVSSWLNDLLGRPLFYDRTHP
ncbi:MerC domain-containing protein [Pendulispora brunnea]|uniref:MerC domain-containing protein n=1 Tax=Pendulispora brunnea TaxID=2905690 RepID=A0ABZ2KH66_9BACT